MAKLNRPNRKYRDVEAKLRRMQSDIEFIIQDIHALHSDSEAFKDNEERIRKLIFTLYSKIYGDIKVLQEYIELRHVKGGGNKKDKTRMFIHIICYILESREICNKSLLGRIFKVDRSAIYYYCKVIPGYLETDNEYKEIYAIINSLLYEK